MFALVLGVTGIGVVSQLTNFMSLLNFVLPLGIPSGLSKFIAEKTINDKREILDLLLNSINAAILPVVISSATIFFLSQTISEQLLDSDAYSFQIKLIALLIPFIVLNSILEGFFRGLNEINVYVKLNIYSNVGGVVLIVLFTYLGNLTGALLGILTINVFYVLWGVYFLLKLKILSSFKFKFYIKSDVMRKLFKLSLVYFISGGLFQLTLLLIRKLIISDLGLYYNGIYQSTIAISLNYFGFIFLSLNTHSLPILSKLESQDDINNELNINLRFINMVIIPLICFVFISRYLVILILYSDKFLEAQDLYFYQFLGDYFKALAWAIGVWLIPKMKLKYFLLIEIALNFNLLVTINILLLLYPKNLECVAIGYLITYVIHFLLNLIVSKRHLNFKFSKLNLKAFVYNFIFILPLLLVSSMNQTLGYILIVPIILLWAFLSVQKEELVKLKQMFLKR